MALRLGADPRSKKPTVRLGQAGRMRQVGAIQWMTFRAEQTISNLHCAFDWRARTGAFGLVSVSGWVIDGVETVYWEGKIERWES